jgi:hypothetical protein
MDKKQAKQKEPCGLTGDQLKRLAEKLHDTRLNVYATAEKLLNAKVNDKVFEDLERVCDLKRCRECGLWKLKSKEFELDFTICVDCACSIDRDTDF